MANIKYLKSLVVLISLLSCFSIAGAQIIINEGSNKNYTQIADEDNETEDWIEIYNSSDNSVNLGGWSLSDNNTIPDKWIFPDITMASNQIILVFASGKDRKEYENGGIWESAVLPGDDFQYTVPTGAIADWNMPDFNDDSWGTGSASFGYEDGSGIVTPVTVVPSGTMVVYIRKTFSIPNTSALIDAICHVDYDDGFVAYLNGVEICRSSTVVGTPSWNSATDGLREAGTTEAFELDMDLIRSVWKQGENVFAAELHNDNDQSSDLTLVPYLSFNNNSGTSYFNPAPIWLTNSSNKFLHSNFKISSQGETIYLYDAQKFLVSSLVVSKLSLNHSVGSVVDGSNELAIFAEATPGASNNTSVAYTEGYTEKPKFSLQAGFYSGSQLLSMSIVSGNSEIHYTTDGSTPTINSALYSGTAALNINSTTTINARSFNTGTGNQLPGRVNTATYFIDDEYTIPVLSVTTDEENLFGTSGIFTNYKQLWNKPCYIEYFDESKDLVISQASGIQVDGGAGGSRSKPQTSFRIEPGNGKFGDGAVNYNFHPERPNRNSYESLYLRNGSNRYLELIYKDAAQVRGMGKNTYNFYSEYRPIVVFINGGYYGMYEGREKINADYLVNNYGMDVDSMDMVGISHFKDPKTILPIVGSAEPFFDDYDRFLDMDPSSPSYLEEVGEFIDLDNYTDYMAGQTWMSNRDWPWNNLKAWRCKGTDMRWQFAIVDLEWSFLPTRIGVNLASTPDMDQFVFLNTQGTKWRASGYWYKLMQNDDYKYQFINRLCDLMNTSYDYTVLGKIENDIYNEVRSEISAYYTRWNGGDNYDFWENHSLFNNDLSIREDYLRQHMKDNYNLNNDVDITLDVQPAGSGRIKISTLVPETYPWDGRYLSDIPITIEAVPFPGYAFTGWDENNNITNLTSRVFTSEISDLSTTFRANFESSEQNTFNGITISEINYKEGDDALNTTDWFEIWNSTNEAISLNGWYFSDNDPSHIFAFNEDQSIAAGERLVVASNQYQFAALYPNVRNITGGFFFGLGRPNDEIKLYNSEDELVVYVKYSDSYPWPLSDDNTGRTLELLNPEASLLEASNWFAGCYMGSPGLKYYPDCRSSEPATILEEEIFEGFPLNVYPNPVQNKLYLEFYMRNGQGNTHVSIYNTMGVLLQKENFDGLLSGHNKITIDVSGLKKGQMYFVLINSNEFQETIKLIKE